MKLITSILETTLIMYHFKHICKMIWFTYDPHILNLELFAHIL
jgi:hypothetical protein